MITATFTAPYYPIKDRKASATVPIEKFEKQENNYVVSTCSFVCYDPIILTYYGLEDNANNLVQLKSIVEVKDDSTTIFYGEVYDNPILMEGNEVEMQVKCRGFEHVLTSCTCPQLNTEGEPVWKWSQSSTAIAALEIKLVQMVDSKIDDTSKYSRYWLPDLTGQFTLEDGKTKLDNTYLSYEIPGTADSLLSKLDIGGDELTLKSKLYNGIGGNGFLVIGTEWIFYDGFYLNDSGYWVLKNLVRNVRGTVEADHAADAVVTFYAQKEIAPDYGWLVKQQDPDTKYPLVWEEAVCGINYFEGVFFIEPYYNDATPTPKMYNYQIEIFPVYDVDDGIGKKTGVPSTLLSLTDILETLVGCDKEYGGAGLTDVSKTVSDIYIPRFDYSIDRFAPYAWETCVKIMKMFELTEEILFYADHETKKLTIAPIKQATTADYYVEDADSMMCERTLEDVPSGILGDYKDQNPSNNAKAPWSWRHATFGNSDDAWDDPEANPLKSCPYGEGITFDGNFLRPAWWDVRNSKGEYITKADQQTKHTVYDMLKPDLMTRAGIEGVSWGHIVDSEPNANAYMRDNARPCNVVFLWFGEPVGGKYPMVNLESIEIVIDTLINGEGKGKCDFSLLGTTNLKMTDGVDDIDGIHPYWSDMTEWRPVSPSINRVRIPYGQASISVKATSFVMPTVNGLCLRLYEGIGAENRVKFHVYNIIALTNVTAYTYVQIRPTGTTLKDGDLVAPNAYSKLRGGLGATDKEPSAPKVSHVTIGNSTPGAAKTLAYQALLSKLRMYQTKTFTTSKFPMGIDKDSKYTIPSYPKIGKTIKVQQPNGIEDQGVIWNLITKIEKGKYSWTFDMINYNAEYIGENIV